MCMFHSRDISSQKFDINTVLAKGLVSLQRRQMLGPRHGPSPGKPSCSPGSIVRGEGIPYVMNIHLNVNFSFLIAVYLQAQLPMDFMKF